MEERSSRWQRAIFVAVIISMAVLGILILAAWLAHRTDNALGTGPLPSNLSGRGAYVLTLITALLGLGAGGAVFIGAAIAREGAGRFSWVYWVVVGVPGMMLLLVPLNTFGNSPWADLPPFLVSVPAHVVVAVALGAVVLGGLDVLKWVSGKSLSRRLAATGTTPVAAAPARGLPGRFTPSAWRTLAMMQEEARRFEHGYMGPEHLLLGLLREDRSVAARALINLGVDIDELRTQVESVIGRRGSLFTGSGGLTRRSQQIIEHAARLARESGDRQVGTGHLLWSYVTKPDDAVGQSLVERGITPTRVSAEAKRLGVQSGEMVGPGGPSDE